MTNCSNFPWECEKWWLKTIGIFLLVFVCAVSNLNAQKQSSFVPPESWVPIPKENLSPLVKIGFLDAKNFGFRASMNLAEEEIDCTLEEYLQAVKQIHNHDHHNTWSNLGSYLTKAGPAILTQIDSDSNWGAIRILQLILVRDSTAYVLTAAAPKKRFSEYLNLFKSAFSSFSITELILSTDRGISTEASIGVKLSSE